MASSLKTASPGTLTRLFILDIISFFKNCNVTRLFPSFFHPQKSKTATMNLYLFRHMITGKVVASTKFALELKHLGTSRTDHLVPFAVATGLSSAEHSAALAAALADPNAGRLLARDERRLPLAAQTKLPRKKLGKREFGVRQPEKADQWTGWSVPVAVKEATQKLCIELGKDTAPTNQVTIHWERDEFRRAVDELPNLMWPEAINHKPLALFRNRYPLVPGLDRRSWLDANVVVVEN
ncbi:hypothetical protein BCR33DRAFT_440705 [Rhizoclosmatium globosum]|uniref:Uncharacterized protein n=1 Tax=Rhizoclosmatium globosum TaxID=329046 RepID=A0A1Y2BTD8_9FUNG|nr:hypothetical protein BCR33DRAFT_440705 [Rhizoclosmatium globosum]|eukprot:ORY37907.1 hypothetical protein BCR33DRAFT_440705 [Rhizoclosmatium globosum]